MSQRFVIMDTETVPDVEAARRLLKLGPDIPDEEVRLKIRQRYAKFAEDPQDAFVKMPMHRLVCLSALVAEQEDRYSPLKVHRIVTGHIGLGGEKPILRSFDRCLGGNSAGTDYPPVIVGWNSSGFDMPLLRWRSMALGVTAENICFRYPEDTPKFRWPNSTKPGAYFARYSDDHIDLCDILASFGATSRATLAEAAAALGIPAKLDGKDGRSVEGMVQAGDYHLVGQYCEEDVCTTFWIFLRYLLACGRLAQASYDESLQSLTQLIRDQNAPRPHLEPFATPGDGIPIAA